MESDEAQRQQETYDEYSEITAAQVLPPSAMAPAPQLLGSAFTESSAIGDDDEDYDEDDRGIGAQTFIGEGAQPVDDVFDDENSDGDVQDDDAIPPGEQDEQDDDADDAPLDEDAEQGVEADGQTERLEGGEAENRNEDVTAAENRSSSPAANGGGAAAFAINRIKQLLKFDVGGDGGGVVIVSNEAATVASQVVALLLQDLTQAAAANTSQQNKKTVTYADIALAVNQLDRFSFLSDVIPMPHTAEPRANNQNTSTAVSQKNRKNQQALRSRIRNIPQSKPRPKAGVASTAGPQMRQTTLI